MESKRNLVAGLLGRIYVPLTPDDILVCLRAMGEASVDEAYLDDLLQRERSDYLSGLSRSAWICPALEPDSGHACDEFITRSDWVMRSRLVFDVLSDSQEIYLLRGFCDLAISIQEQNDKSSDQESLLERIEDLAVHLSVRDIGEKVREGGNAYLLHAYRELAEDAYPLAYRAVKAQYEAAVEGILSLGERERRSHWMQAVMTPAAEIRRGGRGILGASKAIS